MSLTVTPGREEEIDALNASNLPEFMLWESPGNWAWGEIYDHHPALQVVARADGEVVGTMNLVPARRENRHPAPAGFDDVVTQAVDAPGMVADCLSLLSISIGPSARRQGLAEHLLRHAGRLATERGLGSVIGPLRPTRKHLYPLTQIADYAGWTTPEGQAFDPWLRLHLALGGAMVGLAPRSLTITQPVSRWEEATGLRMPADGSYVVAGALAPVVVAGGLATYTEPNIWVSHPVGARHHD